MSPYLSSNGIWSLDGGRPRILRCHICNDRIGGMGYDGLCYRCHHIHILEDPIFTEGFSREEPSIFTANEIPTICNNDNYITGNFVSSEYRNIGNSSSSISVALDDRLWETDSPRIITSVENKSWQIKEFSLTPKSKCRFCHKKLKDNHKKIRSMKLCNNCYDVYRRIEREYKAKNKSAIQQMCGVIEYEMIKNEQ